MRGALAALDALPRTRLVRSSRLYETEPVGGPPGQGEYLNGAALLETELGAVELLAELQRIESEFGRVRTEHWGARTLDLDLLLFGSEVIKSEKLWIPHPRMGGRRFVLEPAAEIARDMVDPVSGRTVGELLAALDADEVG